MADGAGGWKKRGINPKFFVDEFLGRFEAKIANFSCELVDNHDKEKNRFFLEKIRETLNFFQKNENRGKVSTGSCTIVSISVNLKTLHANTFNLGDSGFMIIRNGKVRFYC